MGRVLIRTQAWGTVQNRGGDALPNLSYVLQNTDGSAATHWSAETGGSSSTASLLTDADGGAVLSGADRWVEMGEYDLTVNGRTYRVTTSVSPELMLPSALANSAPYTVYLSQSGSDSNSGRDPGRAVQTVTKAVSLIQQGGHGGEICIVSGAAAGNFDVAAPISIVQPIKVRCLTPNSSTIRRTYGTPNSRSVWDAVTTAAGGTAVSATVAFTNADNGRIVSIYGAGTGGGTYYDFISGNPPNATTANLTATTAVARNSTTDPKGVKLSVVGDWNRVVTDASITAPGAGVNSVITSLTAAWTIADIGTEIVIAGAGQGGQALRGAINAISGTTATITATATTAVTNKRCAIGVNFGDLFAFHSGQSGLEHIILSDQTTGNASIGAAIAIYAEDGAATSQKSPSDIVLDDVQTASLDAAGAWEHSLLCDGSWNQNTGGPGVRRVIVNGFKPFGTRRATETLRIISAVHWLVTGIPSLVAAPTAIAQGLILLDPQNTAGVQASTVEVYFAAVEGQYVYCEGQRVGYSGEIQSNIAVGSRPALELGATSKWCRFDVLDSTVSVAPSTPIDNGISNTILSNLNRKSLTRTAVLVKARGLITETYDLVAGRDYPTTVATTGFIWVDAVGLLAGDVISNLICLCQTSAGSGLTLVKMGLFSSTGTLLRATADFHTPLTTSFNDVALTSPYQITQDGGYYLGLVAVGTTGPSLVRSSATGSISGASLNSGQPPTAASPGAQTDIVTFTPNPTSGAGFWFACH